MTTKKPHGLTGRPSNARKDNPCSSSVFARVTPSQKAAYVKAAGGMKLAEWIKKTLNDAANAKEIRK